MITSIPPPLPTFVQIEPVGYCNLACTMCPVQFRSDAPTDGTPACIDFELYCALIEQFPRLEHLHLQGMGEPLLHPQFFEMVEYATERSIRVTTNSNLTAFSERRAERCIASGLSELHVSIDAAEPELYRSIRVGSRLERVVRNLRFLLAAKQAAASETPRVRMVAVLMRSTLPGLQGLVQLARELGIGQIFVQHLSHDFGEASLPAVYQPMKQFVACETLAAAAADEIQQHFAAAQQLATELQIDLRLPRLDARQPPLANGPRCTWPTTGAYFSYQGYAMPCCMIATPDRLNFGRAASRSVAEIWNGSAYQAFRDGLTTDRPHDLCRSCSVYNGRF